MAHGAWRMAPPAWAMARPAANSRHCSSPTERQAVWPPLPPACTHRRAERAMRCVHGCNAASPARPAQSQATTQALRLCACASCRRPAIICTTFALPAGSHEPHHVHRNHRGPRMGHHSRHGARVPARGVERPHGPASAHRAAAPSTRHLRPGRVGGQRVACHGQRARPADGRARGERGVEYIYAPCWSLDPSKTLHRASSCAGPLSRWSVRCQSIPIQPPPRRVPGSVGRV